MTWLRTEEEANALLDEMVSKNKGRYITQGVAFNKNSESQMKLLKMALMSSYSFGGMIKELLNEKFSDNVSNNSKQYEIIPNVESNDLKQFEKVKNKENKKVGNFL